MCLFLAKNIRKRKGKSKKHSEFSLVEKDQLSKMVMVIFITYYRRRPLIVCNKVSASALDSSPQSKDYGQQLRRLSRSPGDRRLSGVIGGRWLEDAILLLCVVRQASAPSNHLSAWTSLVGSGCLGT